MVFFNYALRKLNAKIVYYGPGLCGKTTNLQWIHDHFEGGQRGKMISLATEGDRTIFFDLLPIDIGTIRGMDVTLQLYTVPGQVHYNSTRQLVLRGADGVVFVADSQRTMRASNVESFENLQENLMLQGIDLKTFPHVLQFNKRDLRDLLSPEDLNENLNLFSVPIFEAVATEGIGVQETLEGIVKLVMRNLREKYEPVASASGPQAPAPMQVGGPPPVAPPAGDPPPADAPTSVAPPASVAPPEAVEPPADEATRDVGFDAGFAAFQDEDEIPTNVYESAKHDPYADTAGPRTPVIDAGAVAASEAASRDDEAGSEEVEPPPADEFDGLFTDPRDEDGTDPEIRLPRSEPAEPDPESEPELEVERSTDPEIVPESLESEPVGEGLDDLFEAEIDAEGEPDAEVTIDDGDDDFAFGRFDEPDAAPESVGNEVAFQADEEGRLPRVEPAAEAPEVPEEREIDADDFAFSRFEDTGDDNATAEAPPVAPPADRYEDRIEAPGPFAPPPMRQQAMDAAGSDDDRQEVSEEVRQALGAAEDLEGLKSLYGEDAGAFAAAEAADEPMAGESPAEPTLDDLQPDPAAREREVLPPFEPPEDTSADAETSESLPDFPFEEPEEPQEPAADAAPTEAAAEELPDVPLEEPEEPAADAASTDAAAEELPPFDAGWQPAELEPVSTPDEPSSFEAAPEASIVPDAVPEEGVEPVTPPSEKDPFARSRPIMVGSGDPFADDESPVTLESAAASVVPVSTGVNVTAEDNQLHLQLKGSGAIAEMGQVRALDIEVPVPGQWVGNRRVTLQLRLTLTPAEEDNG